MFKPIFNYETYGDIDENGNVKSLYTNKIRKTCLDAGGRHGLNFNNKRELIKNLVASTFIREFDADAEEVIFIDGDASNHCLSNLSIVPISDKFKLSLKEAEFIRAKHKAGYSMQSLADEFKVSKTMISQIVNGKRWKSS